MILQDNYLISNPSIIEAGVIIMNDADKLFTKELINYINKVVWNYMYQLNFNQDEISHIQADVICYIYEKISLQNYEIRYIKSYSARTAINYIKDTMKKRRIKITTGDNPYEFITSEEIDRKHKINKVELDLIEKLEEAIPAIKNPEELLTATMLFIDRVKQKDIAEALGVKQSTISHYINKKIKPYLKEQIKKDTPELVDEFKERVKGMI
jgi:RNA polymerase sigma factor (sigma-70 family)